jgi:hypothetical protein
MKTTLSRIVAGAVVSLALVGCSSDANTLASPTPLGIEPADPTNPATLDLNPCADGYSAELNDTIQMAYDFERSAHEMVVCGGANVRFAVALIEVITNIAADPGGDPAPEGFHWDGQGSYHIESDDFSQVSMDVEVRLDADYSFGNAGDLVAYDLFDAATYLVGASIAIDYELGPIISYDSPGPMAELLGFGADPPNPIVLDESNLGVIGAQLRKLHISSEADLYDENGSSEIAYQFSTNPTPAIDLASNAPFLFKLLDASGSNASMAQTMTIDLWDIDYSGFGELDGSIDFRVVGGVFDFKGNFVYAESGYADVTLSCL